MPPAAGRWRHAALVAELVKREFSGRYRGSFGGLAWSFVQPLFLLAVYTLAFGVILRARWSPQGGPGEYALMVFAGLVVFNAFSECLVKAPTLVSGNPNFVRRIVFPLEVLPIVMAAAAMLHAAIGLGIWFLGHLVLRGLPPPTALFAPLVLACFFPVLLGAGWLLAALGAILRDVGPLSALLGHVLLFLTPIFYSVGVVPEWLRPAMYANPLTFIVEELRRVLLGGLAPRGLGLAAYLAAATVFAWAALALFRRVRPRFADLV
jgi:lipopolysaccharide transport system permease protein